MHPSIVLLLMSLSSLQKENRNEVSNNSELSKEERLAKLETYSGTLLSIYLASSFRNTGTCYMRYTMNPLERTDLSPSQKQHLFEQLLSKSL